LAACPAIAVLALAPWLSACAPEPADAPESSKEPARPATVIDPQLEALDKARGVEAQVLDQSNRALDEADKDSR
jgi:hypothetical protein